MDITSDYGGDVDAALALPGVDSLDDFETYYVIDGVAYDYASGDAIAVDDTQLFAPYGDGDNLGIDDMDMDFLAEEIPADGFDSSWYIEMFGDDTVTFDPSTGDVSLLNFDGSVEPLIFNDEGFVTSFVDSSGIPFDSQTPNVVVVDGPDGQYMILGNADGSINITDPTGGNFSALRDSPLVTAATTSTPGVKLPTTPGGTIDNFFALAANIVQTFAQYKTQQNIQASGAYRNTNGGYTTANGAVVRTNASGVPIRTQAAGGMSSSTMLLIGAAILGVVLLTRRN